MPRVLLRLIKTADAADDAASAGFVWANDDERRYLDGPLSAARRQQFIAGHWFARRVLADFTATEAAQWSLHKDDRGALLAHGPHTACVSLSHSGAWIACAVANNPVGIDIEATGKPRDYLGLAQQCCTQAEQVDLARLDADALGPAFLRLWTLKEAWSKREGCGLDLAQFRELSFVPCAAEQADAWSWYRDGISLAVVGKAASDPHMAGQTHNCFTPLRTDRQHPCRHPRTS